ncbi:MAG: radical SAM protein [Candidatus Latescibacterota bacterium]|nr:MAG: radical SAM protein [Candidatus Latescibacterota bacterium]
MSDRSSNERQRFVLDPFEPAYVSLSASELSARVEAALRELEDCCACPRNCHVDRLADQAKACHTGRHARVASASPHFGEEDCLRGWSGSGTIFFSFCNLRCVFCQNWDISQRGAGVELTAEQISDLMLSLQERGCHNINFVTPEHVVPQVIEAVGVAVRNGLRVPIVYNTSAYDSVASLRLLDGIVDIYMPDFKFWQADTATRLAKARDYPERAREAIAEMHRQVGPLRFGHDGVARRGVLVRHLVMPGQLDETRAIMGWLATELSRDTYVNVMPQYRPSYSVGKPAKSGDARYQEIARAPRRNELELARAAARQAGLWRFDERC